MKSEHSLPAGYTKVNVAVKSMQESEKKTEDCKKRIPSPKCNFRNGICMVFDLSIEIRLINCPFNLYTK